MDSNINFSQSYISGRIYYHIDEVDSTNNFLERILKKDGLNQSMVARADYQTFGKGNKGTSWESERGMNLLFSILVTPKDLHVSKQFFISKCVSLAIFDLVKSHLPNEEVKIKWPNDVLIGSDKISGTLIQGSIKNNQLNHNIVGIGLNVNQMNFRKELRATSLKLQLNKNTDVESLLKEMIGHLDERLSLLDKQKFGQINMDYHHNLLSYKVWRTYFHNESPFEGRIFEVADDGRVIMEKKDGTFNKYELKEISLDRDF